MPLTIDTTLMTNVCNWIGQAHNSYIRVIGHEGDQNSPFYWLEAVKSYTRGGNDLTTGLVPAAINTTPGVASVATAAGTTLGVGLYRYQITFVAGGETAGGTEFTITTTTSNTNVAMTAIPTGAAGTTGRKIYRTQVGGATGTERLLGTLAGNITTTFTDNIADAAIVAATVVPTVSTAGTPTVTSNSNATVNITGGTVQINGQLVLCPTNATYGSTSIFSQTATDQALMVGGDFYDAALCVDHLGAFTVFRSFREDRDDMEVRPTIPDGWCVLAWIRINQAGTTSIATGDITVAQVLTAYGAQTNDPAARIFADFDAGQTALISRKAVKNELGFALTSLDKYVLSVTASQGLGTNGAGLSLLAWAKSTHQTATPFDFPVGFAEFIRVLRNGKDHSQRLATISFTGAGSATVTDLKKILGAQDLLELVCTSATSTGAAPSTVTVTIQSYSGTTATIYTANVPANTLNGTVIALAATGTTTIQTPIKGTRHRTRISNSNILSAQPVGTVHNLRVYTHLVQSNPVTVTGGTSGDNFSVRNTGVL
jgi:hypothetical protein